MVMVIKIVMTGVISVYVCPCVLQGDANKSESDDERQSLGYQEEENLKELYAAGKRWLWRFAFEVLSDPWITSTT